MCLSALCARAQFYTHGSDPSNLKWYSTETPYYKIIYPEGTDSLARVYGRLLEQFRAPMGHTIGTTPGGLPKGKKLPVILHISHVTQAGEGEGLLFFGNVILPFVDHFPKDIELYRILTTRPSDLVKYKEEKGA